MLEAHAHETPHALWGSLSARKPPAENPPPEPRSSLPALAAALKAQEIGHTTTTDREW